jgi:hypothetical protein
MATERCNIHEGGSDFASPNRILNSLSNILAFKTDPDHAN